MFEWIAGARDILWVPKWSSTAVTCDVADIGSPTLSRAIPFNFDLVAASTNAKSALSGRHWRSQSPR